MCTYGPVLVALLLIGHANRRHGKYPAWDLWAIYVVAGVTIVLTVVIPAINRRRSRLEL